MATLRPLTPEEEHIIRRKGTEPPGTGRFLHHKAHGLYCCRQCGAPLYRSSDKFDSGCGWPAFDDEIADAVRRIPDHDGYRTEIVCAMCGGHLGHVFEGEGLTAKNTRHCVNSLSLDFVEDHAERAGATTLLGTAYFAAGCFWGVEYCFKELPGVLTTTVGYMGGDLDYPTYRDVCTGDSGHAEAIRITFDPAQVSFEALCRLFFEIHDFTQEGGQGPDIGDQYRSEVFVMDDAQRQVVDEILQELIRRGYAPATRITPVAGLTFWLAEEYHQDYYEKTGRSPYCHARRDVFGTDG